MRNSNAVKTRCTNFFVLLFCIGLLVSWPIINVKAQNVQKHQITGIVRDTKGEPIVGASVVEKGTTNGIMTDVDGRFVLSVKNGSSIQVTSVGYKPILISMNGRSTFEIEMGEDSKTLDEVVVVGYGTQKKSDVTGSVTSINKDRLSKLPVANVMQALEGAAAGVLVTQGSSIPGDAPSTIIRGKNSINASTDPYIVVDGVPISKSGGSLTDINPNDIESMEILKDASAVAIYGTNGANGVILITTKRGKSGKPMIRYSGYAGMEDYAHKLRLRNGAEYVQKYKDYIYEKTGTELTGIPVPNEREEANYSAGKETDWLDEISRTGIAQDHNVSISGGTDNIKYFVSGEYLNQKGILKGYQYKRYSFRMNLDINVTDYLTIGTNAYVAAHNKDGGRVNFLYGVAMSPYAQEYDSDGSYTILPMYPEEMYTSPFCQYNQKAERRNVNINGNGYAEVIFGKIFKPLDGLKYRLNFGYNYLPTRTSTYTGVASYDNNGTAQTVNTETNAYTIENIISYTKDLGKHHFDLTGLFSAQNKKYLSTTAKSVGFVNDLLGFNYLDGGSTQTTSSNSTRYAAMSYMGRLNYSYDSRYLFTFTVRRDGSSVFGANTSKYGTFPSVAVGWNIANEQFMKKLNWLDNLKLRLSYGKSGNEAINVYETISKYNATSIAMSGTTLTGLYASSLGNGDLTWETTKSFNAGLDWGILKNRIVGNFDFYNSRTSGLLLKRNLPKITGYSNVYENIGKTSNIGIEAAITSRNVVTKNFTWETSIVFAMNKNKILDLYGDKTDDKGNGWFIGHPISSVYDYKMLGIWQQSEIDAGTNKGWDDTAVAGDIKFQDTNKDGKITSDDKQILGQTDPKWTGGITNKFMYKNWALSVFIQTAQGMMKNNTDIKTYDETWRINTPAVFGYWTAKNCSQEYPRLTYTNTYGYGYSRKANYTRLKDITLSYTFNEKAISKIGLGSLTIYATGSNLYTWTPWVGWDPEASFANRGSTNWADNYPATKSFVIGINVTLK
jgi:TonB-linked SusC/RagA family outer membrane protein